MAIVKNPAKAAGEKDEGALKRALEVTWVQFASSSSIHGLERQKCF